MDLYKKVSQQINKAIYALLNDFKRYFLDNQSDFSGDFLIINLIQYNNSSVHENTKFSFTDQQKIIEELEKCDSKSNTELGGPIDAINSIVKLDLRDASMRFLFHFCLGSDECPVKEKEDVEVDTEIRNCEVKYELIFFDNKINQKYCDKVSTVINTDINIVNVS